MQKTHPEDNVHGFSPFQLVFGENPKLLSILNGKPLASTPLDTNKILTNNLIALHKAREAFISSENSDKIHHTLSKNIRKMEMQNTLRGQSVLQKGK